MPTITRFEDIQAWQTARALTRLIYKITSQGEFNKDLGLRDQIRRAAVSILSNIAEGFESTSQRQFIRYLGLAKASAGEFRAQLYVAIDIHYIDQSQYTALYELADKCSRQIANFIKYLEANPEIRQVREDSIEYEVDINMLKR